ncbi:NUDIX hydrolase [Pseudomonas sp. P2758]|uniref:NUDIX hydrolase n=1 Tax=Pseudomonas sp. P2758 TaxID=3409916 RepID=UPI003B5990BD
MNTRATVICRRGDQVLFVRKARSKWALPGGKIEPRETPFEAAMRELEEETGIVTDDLIQLARFEVGDTTHFVFITHLSSDQKPSPSNEIAACKWHSWKRFRDLDLSPAMKAVVKTFAGFELKTYSAPNSA